MNVAFKKAIKYQAKGRIALAGPSGSGKTWTALTIATALADDKRVAVIDTERGSASKYSDVFDFDVVEIDTFHPNNFIKIIHEADHQGFGALVIDSLSHAWNGTGGILEIVDQATKHSQSKNSFNAWGEATPLQNRLIDAITRANMHIICTMRSKTEYVLEKTEQGKTVPRKVGTAPVQRADVEYEFDVYADLDIEHNLIVQKSRCPALADQVISRPDEHMAEILKAWLDGAPLPERSPEQEMRHLLEEFYRLAPMTYARIPNWEDQALRKALEISEEESVPTAFTHDDVARMTLYVSSKRRAS